MADHGLLTTALLFSLSPLNYSHAFVGHRLLLLAVAGLAGLYMVHLLAEDYNTYQCYNSKPGNNKGWFGKRSIPDNDLYGHKRDLTTELDESRDLRNALPRLDLALKFDPVGCARRYVCTIATRSPKKLTQSQRNIIDMLRSVARKGEPNSGATAFRDAMELGRVTRDPQACSAEYSKCLLDLSQILKLLNLF